MHDRGFRMWYFVTYYQNPMDVAASQRWSSSVESPAFRRPKSMTSRGCVRTSVGKGGKAVLGIVRNYVTESLSRGANSPNLKAVRT